MSKLKGTTSHAGLVNCTTIDWFTEWPADALHEVAAKQLAEENLGSEETKANMCKVFVTAHQSVSDMSKQMLQQLKRHNYVTPTNYLETVRGYRLACSCMAGVCVGSECASLHQHIMSLPNTRRLLSVPSVWRLKCIRRMVNGNI